MNIKALLLTLLIIAISYFVWYREGLYKPDLPQPWLAKSIRNTDRFSKEIAMTVKHLPEVGAYISNISVKRGLRAMHGEVAGPGEVKISFNLSWQLLPGSLSLREVLDWTAALVITEVFNQHQNVSKIRVLLKIPKKNKNVPEKMGKALGYKNAAKVFSITRAAWALAKRREENYNPATPQGAANTLALGDYVVLTDDGWARGY